MPHVIGNRTLILITVSEMYGHCQNYWMTHVSKLFLGLLEILIKSKDFRIYNSFFYEHNNEIETVAQYSRGTT